MSEATPELSEHHASEPWLSVTGQRWKFWVYMSVTLAALAMIVSDVFDVDIVADYLRYPRTTIAVLILGTFSVAWLVLSVRCKRCGGYPTWFLMTTAPASRWLSTLLTAASCPKCGDRPERSGEHAG